jgi:hypothetical protein
MDFLWEFLIFSGPGLSRICHHLRGSQSFCRISWDEWLEVEGIIVFLLIWGNDDFLRYPRFAVWFNDGKIVVLIVGLTKPLITCRIILINS